MRPWNQERAVSPVIGVALLIAIVVALAVLSGSLFLALGEERDPAPGVTMSLETTDMGATQALVHETGDTLDGDRVELRGVADDEALAGTEVGAGERQQIVPTDTDIELVWFGDDGSSYVIWEGTVPEDETVPEPDHGCSWVENNSDDEGNVKAEGAVVDCDVRTDKVIEVNDDGVVIGNTDSNTKNIDADNAMFYGDVTGDTDVNAQDSLVTGAVISNDTAKIDNTTVGEGVDASDTVEVIAGSSTGDDVTSDTSLVKVLDSDVDGAIATDGSVKLDGATVEGDVYVNAGDFDCTDSTIDGQDCSAYSPKDPDDY